MTLFPSALLQHWVSRIKQSALAKNSLVYTVDFSLQIGVQAAYVLLLSRALGPANFGLFSSLTAVSIIGSMFVGWGCDQVLIKNVAVNRNTYSDNLGHSLIAMTLTLPIVFLITGGFATQIAAAYAISLPAVAAILIADLCFTRLLFFSKSCFAAIDRTKPQLLINIVATLAKLAAAIAATSAATNLTVDRWALWYCASTAVGGVLGMALVLWQLDRPRWIFLRRELGLGFQFCLEFAALAALRDADKPVVVSSLGAEAGGHYAVAFRVVDAASSPIRGLLFATYTRYFRMAEESTKGGIAFGLRVLPIAVGISGVLGVALYALAWLLPYLLGPRYAASVQLVQLLAIYPLLLAMTGISADILRAIGMQKLRVILIGAASLAIFPACAWAAQVFGLTGTVLARVAVQILLVLLCWGIVLLRQNSNR